jgi:bifunctional NMN adenylyltransferase/nudix hydrolase
MRAKTIGVVIGRFQCPSPHQGHRDLIRMASINSDAVTILIGSADSARSIKNPWTYSERRDSIKKFLSETGLTNIKILPLNDHLYSDVQWVQDVIISVNADSAEEVTLYGHDKPGNYYLKLFPQWKYANIETSLVVSGSSIRASLFENERELLPESVLKDYDYFKKEASLFKDYPFPETLSFSCADAIVECSSHLLLIKRKFAPGAGTWAFPGGFKNRNETFFECAIREAYEETNLRVPIKILSSSLVKFHLFDSISRGCGIPRVTVAHHFKIEPNQDLSLPRCNGADDAVECGWFPIDEILNNVQMFDDHKGIAEFMTNTSSIPAALNKRYNI